MQEQEKKNKGFSLLEIIVVLAIVGALAGVGIPNFAKWNNKRIISNASEEVASLLRNIHATTERGTFAYVQLIFESDNEDGISIKTKGVTMDNFTTIMNDTSANWNTSIQGFVSDGRIGHSHIQVPGPDGKLGFGGNCLPKDVKAIIEFSNKMGIKLNTIEGAWNTNVKVRPNEDLKDYL